MWRIPIEVPSAKSFAVLKQMVSFLWWNVA